MRSESATHIAVRWDATRIGHGLCERGGEPVGVRTGRVALGFGFCERQSKVQLPLEVAHGRPRSGGVMRSSCAIARAAAASSSSGVMLPSVCILLVGRPCTRNRSAARVVLVGSACA